jgi:hypothetical protein
MQCAESAENVMHVSDVQGIDEIKPAALNQQGGGSVGQGDVMIVVVFSVSWLVGCSYK